MPTSPIPRAHEDDPERAVRAGFAILNDLAEMNRRLEREHDVRISVRVGIHTGTVVVAGLGRGETRETLALGHTVNVTERLQQVAAPDRLVMSAAPLASAQQCREQDRSFLVRNRMSPSQRREALDRCLAVAQMLAAPPAPAPPNPVVEASYVTR